MVKNKVVKIKSFTTQSLNIFVLESKAFQSTTTTTTLKLGLNHIINNY